MNPTLDWGEILFSATGRMRQLPFVIASVGLLFVLAFYQALLTTSGLKLAIGLIVYFALVYMGACVLAKRLHDRGRSGWWAVIILVAIFMVWPAPSGFFDFIAVVVLVWAFIDLALMPGERGDNRYGRTLYRSKTREPS